MRLTFEICTWTAHHSALRNGSKRRKKDDTEYMNVPADLKAHS